MPGEPIDIDAIRRDIDGARTAQHDSLWIEYAGHCVVHAEALLAEVEALREMARRARDEADDLRDAVDCLGRIGDMVGFGQADWGKDDRVRLVREVRDALAEVAREHAGPGEEKAT